MQIDPRHKRLNGFTIVELLIAVAVIGILAAITTVAYNGIQQSAKTKSVMSDLTNASGTLALYYSSNNQTYPSDLSTISNGGSMAASPGTSYLYHQTGTAYCLTATNGTVSYNISDSTDVPAAGGCPGDGVGGVAAITNLSTNPRMISSATGWYSNNGAIYPVTRGVAVAGQPNGIVTAAQSQLAAGQSSSAVLSIYNIDNMGNSATSRTVGVWVYASTSGYRAYIIAASPVKTNLPLATWVYIQTGAPLTGWAMVTVEKISGVAGSTDYAYATGSMSVAGSTNYNFADGTSSPSWIWNGATNSSTSTGPPQ